MLGHSDTNMYCPSLLSVGRPTENIHPLLLIQYTDQEMIPVRNARNVVRLAEVMFVTIQCENILPSKITDY
jgi:hypothetical protein